VHSFAVLPSCLNPRLVVPLEHTSAALRAFDTHDSSSPRRIWQRALPLAIGRHVQSWFADRLSLPAGSLAGLEALVAASTGEENPRFAICVPASADAARFTMQVMRPDGATLGHIKFPLHEAGSGRISHEAAVLTALRRFPVLWPHIPRVLFAGQWKGRPILFQSPAEGVPGPVMFNGLHAGFLQDLRRATAIQRSGAALVEDTAALWNAADARLDSGWRELGRDALCSAGRLLRKSEIVCGLSHGDFAPWNTRLRDGRLFVFDWEHAEWDVPVWWDLFHFDLQVSSLLGRKSGIEMKRVEAPAWNGLYLLYMLRSVIRAVDDRAGAAALEYRRARLTSLMAGRYPLRVLRPVRAGLE
jgi:hypothetical protein